MRHFVSFVGSVLFFLFINFFISIQASPSVCKIPKLIVSQSLSKVSKKKTDSFGNLRKLNLVRSSSVIEIYKLMVKNQLLRHKNALLKGKILNLKSKMEQQYIALKYFVLPFSRINRKQQSMYFRKEFKKVLDSNLREYKQIFIYVSDPIFLLTVISLIFFCLVLLTSIIRKVSIVVKNTQGLVEIKENKKASKDKRETTKKRVKLKPKTKSKKKKSLRKS